MGVASLVGADTPYILLVGECWRTRITKIWRFVSEQSSPSTNRGEHTEIIHIQSSALIHTIRSDKLLPLDIRRWTFLIGRWKCHLFFYHYVPFKLPFPPSACKSARLCDGASAPALGHAQSLAVWVRLQWSEANCCVSSRLFFLTIISPFKLQSSLFVLLHFTACNNPISLSRCTTQRTGVWVLITSLLHHFHAQEQDSYQATLGLSV